MIFKMKLIEKVYNSKPYNIIIILIIVIDFLATAYISMNNTIIYYNIFLIILGIVLFTDIIFSTILYIKKKNDLNKCIYIIDILSLISLMLPWIPSCARVLRLLRLFRILKVTKLKIINNAFNVFFRIITNNKQHFIVILILLTLSSSIIGASIYYTI